LSRKNDDEVGGLQGRIDEMVPASPKPSQCFDAQAVSCRLCLPLARVMHRSPTPRYAQAQAVRELCWSTPLHTVPFRRCPLCSAFLLRRHLRHGTFPASPHPGNRLSGSFVRYEGGGSSVEPEPPRPHATLHKVASIRVGRRGMKRWWTIVRNE
jgi:hypothetical protein